MINVELEFEESACDLFYNGSILVDCDMRLNLAVVVVDTKTGSQVIS